MDVKDAIRVLHPPRLAGRIDSFGPSPSSASPAGWRPPTFGSTSCSSSSLPLAPSAAGGIVGRTCISDASDASGHRRRFSELLLEHGERHLQDWAAEASSEVLDGWPDGDGDGGGGGPGGGRRRRSRSGSSLWSPSSSSLLLSATSLSSTPAAPSVRRSISGGLGVGVGVVVGGERRPSDSLSPPPSASMGRIRGRLRLCCRSVVFEPDDAHRGIVRCPFSRMSGPPFRIRSGDGASRTAGAAAAAVTVTSASLRASGLGGAVGLHGPVGADPSNSNFSVAVRCDRHLVMKANNVIGPYDSVEVPAEFRFRFLHSSPEQFLELATTLFRMYGGADGRRSGLGGGGGAGYGGKGRLGGKGGGGGSGGSSSSSLPPAAESSLDDLLRPMLDRPFDPSNLVDVRERPRTPNLRCSILRPLLVRRGCCIVTDRRLYFQPVPGVAFGGEAALASASASASASTLALASPAPRATSWALADVVATARRYHGLKDCALEMYSRDGASVLLAYETSAERERVMSLLPRNVPCHTDRAFVVEASRAWRMGTISNFEYLLALNSAAGRTFHDLSRYPVFPWIIADYESRSLDLKSESTYRDLTKPVGALDPDRLEYFQTRFEAMHDMDHPFLYGTHYSAPGYVLYYLVRQMPEHMLCLQNGKFDAADRMFHDVSHTYRSVLTNHADVKELIPEFYDPAGGFDFLINARGLQLGSTQTGDRVNDVRLPRWARSARDFLKKNRRALDSDVTSSKLHRWIDLVFGCMSRGDGARESKNLFHPSAYLGPADFDRMTTEEERTRAELQAMEFGIVPDLLFCAPHPPRGAFAAGSAGRGDNDVDSFVAHDSGRAAPPPSEDGDGFGGGGDDALNGGLVWGIGGGGGGVRGGSGSVGGGMGVGLSRSSGSDQPWELLDAPMNKGTSFDEGDDAPNADVGRGTAAEPMPPLFPPHSIPPAMGFGSSFLSPPGSEVTKYVARGREEEVSASRPRGAAAETGASFHVSDEKNEAPSSPARTQLIEASGNEWVSNVESKNLFEDDDDDDDDGGSGSNAEVPLAVATKGWTAPERAPLSLSGAGKRPPNGAATITRTFSSEDGFEAMSAPPAAASSSSSSSSHHRSEQQKHPPSQSVPDAESQHPGWEMRPIASKKVHNDSVTGCHLLIRPGAENRSYLTTVSLDGGLIVHTLPSLRGGVSDGQDAPGRRSFTAARVSSTITSRLAYLGRPSAPSSSSSSFSSSAKAGGAGRGPPQQSKLQELRHHSSSDPLACLAFASDGEGGCVAFAGGHDDVVFAYGINSACALASVYSHRDAVTGIGLLRRKPRGAEMRREEETASAALFRQRSPHASGTHIMVTGSWDATVKVWSATVAPGEAVTIDREPIAELYDADSPVLCVSATAAVWGGAEAVAICAGCSDGTVIAWLCRDDGGKELIYKEEPKRGGGPCSAVAWAPDSILFAGFGSGRVVSYSLQGQTLLPLSRLSVGSPVQCIAVLHEDKLLVGCSDGGLRFVPVGEGACFDSNPRLWRSVNGPSAPTLSSIGVGYLRTPFGTKQICATGADDGTVVLFELKEV